MKLEINSKTNIESAEIINEYYKGMCIGSLSCCCDQISKNEKLKGGFIFTYNSREQLIMLWKAQGKQWEASGHIIHNQEAEK